MCEAKFYRDSVSLSSSTFMRSSSGGRPSALFCPAPVSWRPFDTFSWPRSTTTALLDCEFCGMMTTGAFSSTFNDTRDARDEISWAAAVARSAAAEPAAIMPSLATWNWFTKFCHATQQTQRKTDSRELLLLLLVCVSFTIIGQPRNSVLIRRV